MTQVRREGIEHQLGPERSHRLYVVQTAKTGALNALRSQLGGDVLDDQDRAAMYGPQYPVQAEVPTPTVAPDSNVVQFPVRPEAAAAATTIISEQVDPVEDTSYLDSIRADEYPTIEQRAA